VKSGAAAGSPWLFSALLATLWLAFSLAATPVAAASSGPIPATGTVEVVFSPWDDGEGAIIRCLNEALHTIYVQAYVLTSRPIARALQVARGRGVAVYILADADMAEKGTSSQIPRLAAEGMPIWLETRYAAAHNKVILIDTESGKGTVITGSYNFSWSAQARNAENLLILRGNPALGRRYLDNWKRHRAEAQAWKVRH